MSVESFTDPQVDKARHALGLSDRNNVAYRNHYVAVDDPDWDDLVRRGFATKRKSPVSPEDIYHLTKPAAFFFMNPNESIDVDCRFPSSIAKASP